MPIYLGHGTFRVWGTQVVSRLIQQRSDQPETANRPACVLGIVYSDHEKNSIRAIRGKEIAGLMWTLANRFGAHNAYIEGYREKQLARSQVA